MAILAIPCQRNCCSRSAKPHGELSPVPIAGVRQSSPIELCRIPRSEKNQIPSSKGQRRLGIHAKSTNDDTDPWESDRKIPQVGKGQALTSKAQILVWATSTVPQRTYRTAKDLQVQNTAFKTAWSAKQSDSTCKQAKLARSSGDIQSMSLRVRPLHVTCGLVPLRANSTS